jgi:hypothetical protein
MSTDTFEDELRSLLRETADAEGPAYVDVDPHAVVTSGRRVIRRRRLAAGAGIAAAVAALGLAAWAAVGSGVDHDAAPVPAASITATAPVNTVLERSGPLNDAKGREVVAPVRVRVGVDPLNRTWSHAFVGDDGEPVSITSEPLPAGGRATWTQSSDGPGVVTGLLPERATDFVTVWSGDAPTSTSARAPLPGTGYQSFALWHSGGPSTQLGALYWTDGQQVYTSLGTRIRSAKFDDALAFVDETTGLYGIFGQDGSVTKQVDDTPADWMPAVMSGKQEPGSAMVENTVLVLLPAGADRAEVKAVEGATLLSAHTAGGQGTNRMMVLTRLLVPSDSPDTGIDYVRWTDSDGAMVLSQVG